MILEQGARFATQDASVTPDEDGPKQDRDLRVVELVLGGLPERLAVVSILTELAVTQKSSGWEAGMVTLARIPAERDERDMCENRALPQGVGGWWLICQDGVGWEWTDGGDACGENAPDDECQHCGSRTNFLIVPDTTSPTRLAALVAGPNRRAGKPVHPPTELAWVARRLDMEISSGRAGDDVPWVWDITRPGSSGDWIEVCWDHESHRHWYRPVLGEYYQGRAWPWCRTPRAHQGFGASSAVRLAALLRNGWRRLGQEGP